MKASLIISVGLSVLLAGAGMAAARDRTLPAAPADPVEREIGRPVVEADLHDRVSPVAGPPAAPRALPPLGRELAAKEPERGIIRLQSERSPSIVHNGVPVPVGKFADAAMALNVQRDPPSIQARIVREP